MIWTIMSTFMSFSTSYASGSVLFMVLSYTAFSTSKEQQACKQASAAATVAFGCGVWAAHGDG